MPDTEELPLSLSGIVVKPREERQTVIYLYCLAGWWYAGKRDVPLRYDVRSWPSAGTGRLPDGYGGSGGSRFEDIVGWEDVKRLHGIEHARWWIVETLIDADRATIEAAERDAIAGAREQFGDRCVNHAKGGGGPSPEGARRMGEKNRNNPEFQAMMKARNEDPKFRTRMAEARRKQAKDPKYLAKITEINRKQAEDPEWLANVAAAKRATSGIAPLDGVITVLVSQNPRRSGRRCLAFSLYRTGQTVAEFLDACEPHGLLEPRSASQRGSLAGSALRQDIRDGHIRIDSPSRVAAISPTITAEHGIARS